MPAPININLNYTSQVQEAIKAANAVNAQFSQMSQNAQNTLVQAAQLSSAMKQLGQVSNTAGNQAASGWKNFSNEMARAGVFVNKTMASMAGSIQSFGTIIKSSLSGLSGGAGGVFGGAQNLISEFSRSVSDFIGSGGFVQNLGKAVAAGAKGFVKLGTDIGSFIIKGIGTVAATIPKVLGELTQLTGSITGLFAGLGGTVTKMGGLFVGLFVSGVANAAGSVFKAFGTIIDGLTNLTVTAFSGIGDTIAAALGGAIEIVSAFADRVGAIIGDIGGKIADILGKTIAGGLAISLPVAFKGAEFRNELAASFGVVADQVTAQEFEQLVAGAKQVGKDLGVSLSDIPQALFKQVSFGFTTIEHALGGMTAAARLAAVGNVDLFKALEAINISTSAYGKGIGNAEEVSRKLFNATREGRIEIQDLTDHLGLVVGSAEAAGVSFEELLTIVNLAVRILPSSTAVFGLGNAIKSLQKPTKEATDSFATFFEKVKEGDGSLKSFKVVLEELRRSGLALDPKAFREIFPDERGARAVRVLLGQVGKDFENYDRVIKSIGQDHTTFGQVAEFALNTVIKRITGLGASVISVGDSFVQKFKGPIIAGINAVQGVLERFEQSIISIDPKFVERLTIQIGDFVKSIPEKVKGVTQAFGYVVDVIKTATIAAKEFLDQNLNITATIKELLAGDFKSAFDLFFGSNAITKVKGFFQVMVAEAQNAIGFVKQLGLATFESIKTVASGILNNPSLGLLKNLIPGAGGGNLTGHDVAKFGIQTVAGVNPIQKPVAAATSAAGYAGIGAGIGAAYGSVVPGLGTLAGAGIGALIGGIAGWTKSMSHSNELQETINTLYDQFIKDFNEQQEILKKRNAATEKGAESELAATQAKNELEALQIKLARRIADATEQRAPILERIAEAEKNINVLWSNVQKALDEGYAVIRPFVDALHQTHGTELDINATLQAYAEHLAEIRSNAEIVLKLDERQKAVKAKTVELQQGYNNQLLELVKAGEVLEAELKALKNPPQKFIQRGTSVDDVFGKPIGGGIFDQTQRNVTNVGGDFETRLLKAFEDLIEALDENVKSQEALKKAMDPRNIDESNKYLSVNARSAKRRADKEDAKAYAKEVNAQFGSGPSGLTPNVLGGAGDNGLFGFGRGAPQRQIAFGGGAGFGPSLPGQKGGFGAADNAQVIKLLQDILAGRGPEAPPDIQNLLTGAPSRAAQVRGKKGPFEGVDETFIKSLKDLILGLAEKSEIFGKGKDAKDELVALTKSVAKDGDSTVQILEKVLDALHDQIKNDKEAKRKLEEDEKKSPELRKKEKEVEENRRKRGEVKGKRDKAEETAEATIEPFAPEEIKAARVQEEKGKASAISEQLAVAQGQLETFQLDLEATNAEIEFDIAELQGKVNNAAIAAEQAFAELRQTSIGLLDSFLDIGNNFLESAKNMNEELKATRKRTDQLDADVNNLKRQIQGK